MATWYMHTTCSTGIIQANIIRQDVRKRRAMMIEKKGWLNETFEPARSFFYRANALAHTHTRTHVYIYTYHHYTYAP